MLWTTALTKRPETPQSDDQSYDPDGSLANTYQEVIQRDIRDCRAEISALGQGIESDKQSYTGNCNRPIDFIEVVDELIDDQSADVQTCKQSLEAIESEASALSLRVDHLWSIRARIDHRMDEVERRNEDLARRTEEALDRRQRTASHLQHRLQERFETRVGEQENEWRLAYEILGQQVRAEMEQQGCRSATNQESLATLVHRMFCGAVKSGLSGAIERVKQLAKEEVGALRRLVAQVSSDQISSELSRAIAQVDDPRVQDTNAMKLLLDQICSGQVPGGL